MSIGVKTTAKTRKGRVKYVSYLSWTKTRVVCPWPPAAARQPPFMSWRIWDFGFIADKTAAAPRRINYKPYALPASQHLSSSFSQGRLTTNHWMHNLNIFLAYLSFPMKQQLLGGSTTNHMPCLPLNIFLSSFSHDEHIKGLSQWINQYELSE